MCATSTARALSSSMIHGLIFLTQVGESELLEGRGANLLTSIYSALSTMWAAEEVGSECH